MNLHLRAILGDIGGDLRYASRQLRKSPTFTTVAILTLAIGIGANTIIFSQVNAVMLKMLPVKDPEQLHQLEWTSKDREFAGSIGGSTGREREGNKVSEYFSYHAFTALHDGSKSFSDLACYASQGVNFGVGGRSDWGSAYMVSSSYFQTLGSEALMGRTILPDDDKVAVLSFSFWQRTYDNDTAVLGRSIQINGTPFTIIGVMPRAYFGIDPGSSADVIVPIAMYPAFSGTANALDNDRHWTACRIVGRLKAEVPAVQAQAESDVIVKQVVAAANANRKYDPPKLWLTPIGHGLEYLRASTAPTLLVLMGVVGVILLVACANVGGLLLARATVRQKEVATRLALGASRGRLIRQLLTESLLLSISGGALGLALTYAFNPLMPTPLNNRVTSLGVTPPGVDITPDTRVLAFSILLAAATGVVFGIAPAFRATRVDLLAMMKGVSNAASSRFRFTGGKALVAVQVALSLLLLIGAGLFIRTVANLRSVPLGFDPDGLLVFRVNPALNGYAGARLRDYFENTVKRLEAAPGVISVSVSQVALLSGNMMGSEVGVPGYTPKGPNDSNILYHVVAPRFFETWKIPLLLGRDIQWTDRDDSPKVVIVNESFVRKFFPDSNPIGRMIRVFNANSNRPPDTTIIGVAADSKYHHMKEESTEPTLYLPFRQQSMRSAAMVLRTQGDPLKLVAAVRQEMAAIDSTVPMVDVITEADQVNRRIQQERQLTIQLILFGAVALLLCAIGIYGMLAYTVGFRTPEIGLRMALGAQRSNVVSMVIHESLIPVIIGIAMGLTAAFALTRLVESMLYGVKPNDPATIVIAAAVFLLIAAGAASVPARRASRTQPMSALRYL